MTDLTDKIGVVVIGRNEGERLKRCLKSVLDQTKRVVYVDSGSSDGSVEYAESIMVEVVRLNMQIPFTAGRARNKGVKHLLKKHDKLQYIQFVDGDCELCQDWLFFAAKFIEEKSDCAVSAGRTKEKYPEQSIYNLLCDIEWNTPIGETEECGGNFIVTVTAFSQVKGFNPAVIAGEDSELCYRLRQAGWKIHRLDHLMTLHDAAIFRFSQWWKRTVRSGYAYAQSMALHGKGPEKYRVRQSLSIWFWGIVLPFFLLVIIWPKIWLSFLIIIAIYTAQVIKIAVISIARTQSNKISLYYSFFMVLGRVPALIGQIKYWFDHLSKREHVIIEYK